MYRNGSLSMKKRNQCVKMIFAHFFSISLNVVKLYLMHFVKCLNDLNDNDWLKIINNLTSTNVPTSHWLYLYIS